MGRVLCGASFLGASCLWGELSVIRLDVSLPGSFPVLPGGHECEGPN